MFIIKAVDKIDITIVGAGVVGLAIARELSYKYQDIFVIEKNSSFGQETSSRNSEVIHAGIYYPEDSLKTKTCIEGKNLLYEYCLKNNILHKKIGKLIVAINDNEVSDLERLFKHGLENGVRDLRLLSSEEFKESEPNVVAKAAIYSPSTGIIDSHSLMKSLVFQFESNRGQIAYNSELKAIEKTKEGFLVTVEDKSEEAFKFSTGVLINCAGLNSDKIARLIGLDKEEYRLKYCKGDYFRVHNNKALFINRLIYPVPKEDRAGLGIHATLDLAGGLRLGPDDEYVDRIDYNIDESNKNIFYESVRQFLPFIELEDVAPDTSGIRPKLQGPKEEFRDFIIRDETDNGHLGFINLIGIESPGLTCCLSIARIVKEMVRNSLRK
ncbi:MAG: NAD(P)/FAD-dependent oxidoreductase [Candidatus Omnitrophota bacterium]